MPGPTIDSATRDPAETPVVASDRLRAAQWETFLAAASAEQGRRTWQGRSALAYAAWAERAWAASRPRGGAEALLSPRQSEALWQRVVAESPEGGRLLGTSAAAGWARQAWRLERRFRIPIDRHSDARGRPDFAAWLGWRDDYRRRLRESGWLDDALLDEAIGHAIDADRSAAARVGPFCGADLELGPSQRALLDRLRAAGVPVRQRSAPAVSGRASRLGCAEPGEELLRAGEWARRRLADGPVRVAIVVPDLAARAAEVRRGLRQRLDGCEAQLHLDAAAAADIDARPLLGAALNALELLSGDAGYAALSRWLRSPFFARDPVEQEAAARLEARLRRDALAQLPFIDAYRRAGLRDLLAAALPGSVMRIDAALHEIGPLEPPSMPASWSARMARALAALGWRGWPSEREAGEAERAVFERALLELASLTPIVGEISHARALAELRSGLERALSPGPLPIDGVHVLADLADVGPGYAGAWVVGATERALPRPVRVNPLLPTRAQVEQGVPWSSPRDALERSRAAVAGLIDRVPETIFSWPASVGGEPAEPSPLLNRLPKAASDPPPPRRPVYPRARVQAADPPPPLPEGAEIEGGTAALNVQAACPLRAFCEHRLHARALESTTRGLASPARGRALHRAVEVLYRRYDSRHALDAAPADALDAAVKRAARHAAARAFGPAGRVLEPLLDLEAERVAALVGAFVARERERAPFRVEALEHDTTLRLRNRVLRLRIDRLDVLESGGLAVIDYKSGSRTGPSDWLAPRPRDVQLPAYALALPEPPAAVVVAALRAEGVGYRGLWEPADAFPGRRGQASGPAARVAGWRERLAALIDELSAGDIRFFPADVQPAAGAYAALTRVYEQLALHGGPV